MVVSQLLLPLLLFVIVAVKGFPIELFGPTRLMTFAEVGSLTDGPKIPPLGSLLREAYVDEGKMSGG